MLCNITAMIQHLELDFTRLLSSEDNFNVCFEVQKV